MCITSVLLKSPLSVFSLRSSWKLSLSSISRALMIRVSSRDFSSSCSLPPPLFSSSISFTCDSTNSRRSTSIVLSFCIITLELAFESLRCSEDGGANWPFSISIECRFRGSVGPHQLSVLTIAMQTYDLLKVPYSRHRSPLALSVLL